MHQNRPMATEKWFRTDWITTETRLWDNNFLHPRSGIPLLLPMSNYPISHTHTSPWEWQKTNSRTSICNIIVMLKLCHHVTSQPIQGFLEVFFMFFQYKMQYLVVNKKKNPLFEWGWDRKIHPSRPLSSLSKPYDANRWSVRWIFLSYPHTHDRFIHSGNH